MVVHKKKARLPSTPSNSPVATPRGDTPEHVYETDASDGGMGAVDRDIIISMDLLRELSLEGSSRQNNVVELAYDGMEMLPLRTSFSRNLECNAQKRAQDRTSAGLTRSCSAPLTPLPQQHVLPPVLHLHTLEKELDRWPKSPRFPDGTVSIVHAYRTGSGNLNSMKQKHW